MYISKHVTIQIPNYHLIITKLGIHLSYRLKIRPIGFYVRRGKYLHIAKAKTKAAPK